MIHSNGSHVDLLLIPHGDAWYLLWPSKESVTKNCQLSDMLGTLHAVVNQRLRVVIFNNHHD
jgi:hypothetical protein